MKVFYHEMGICAYMDKCPQNKDEIKKLRRWINWHRRRGVGYFYLYASSDTGSLREALAGEINNGLVLILRVNGTAEERLRLGAYDDCLKRARYACEYVAFLQAGEYLVPEGRGSLPEVLRGQFRSICAVLYMETAVGIRCIVRPCAVKNFNSGNNMNTYQGWGAKKAEGLALSLQCQEKRIALLSHVMARNGAPLALLSVAKALREAGYELDVFSAAPGSLEREFAALGAEVHVDPNLHGTPLADQPWYTDYDLIFANTAVMEGCFHKPCLDTPVIWWLHESPSSLRYCGISKDSLAKLQKGNITTLGVSKAARDAFLALRPDWPMAGDLVLGVEDVFSSVKRKSKKKKEHKVFLVVGTIEENKGQEIFLQAVGMLDSTQREKCEFWLVGGKNSADKSDYYDRVIAMAAKYPEVKVMDFQPHEKILEMYGDVDAVVVPSREETLSLVAVEAMMMGVPCIVSKSLGVAYHTQNGENVILFDTGNGRELGDILSQVLNECDRFKKLGKEGRVLYEQEFSIDKFKKNLLYIINEQIGSNSEVKVNKLG